MRKKLMHAHSMFGMRVWAGYILASKAANSAYKQNGGWMDGWMDERRIGDRKNSGYMPHDKQTVQ
jgi:hypothetical protein